jgi:hypothetical protein
MDWFKKHTDTVAVIGAIIASMLWMNTKFNDIDKRLTVIETVLIMKDIMPSKLAKVEKE